MVLGRIVSGLVRKTGHVLKALVIWPVAKLWAIAKGAVTRPTGAVFGLLKSIFWGPIQRIATVTKSTALAIAIVVPIVVGLASLGLGIAIAAVWLLLVAKRRLDVTQ